ncbi:hypothetical protein OG496_22890 [Streptomyces sp. NBC_00988]|uniref:hypothetical protein n=1 Tax=Streptomyces sp. NBC_00988 TaxID=2903704 RepID=UPI00386744F4|nr:hypothetical protein OG496_22890 [Streptomyces sp. NBC_00988]
MTVTLFGTVADPAHHAMTANLCAVAAAPARSATTTIPRGTLAAATQRMMAASPCTVAAATRHPVTANVDAAVAAPARPTTSPIPHAPDTPAPHRRPTSRAPHHRTPPPVAHPKGTPCR